MKFSGQTADVESKMVQRSNWILRYFIVTDVKLYVKLFLTFILPILNYASPVWRPGLKKDQVVLQKAVNKYFRRVSYRYKVCIKGENVCNVSEIFNKNDEKILSKIISESRAAKFFKTTEGTTRSGTYLRPVETATRKVVQNLFSWRVT